MSAQNDEKLVAAVLKRVADAPGPLVTTQDLLSQIEVMDAKIKALNFQKQHATSISRRNSLVHAMNALTLKRNTMLKRYKQTVGLV